MQRRDREKRNGKGKGGGMTRHEAIQKEINRLNKYNNDETIPDEERKRKMMFAAIEITALLQEGK